MKALIAVSICIFLPLIPQLIALWLLKTDPRDQEEFVQDYR